MVGDDGHALLGDFGQSYASDSGKYLDSTRVGLAAYNPVHWMAPELIDGGDRARASDKSDIYSFGCVLYEVSSNSSCVALMFTSRCDKMVSGKIPFEGLSAGRVVNCVQNGERPNSPESISSKDPFWKAVQLCWKSRPEDRRSATHLVSLLR